MANTHQAVAIVRLSWTSSKEFLRSLETLLSHLSSSSRPKTITSGAYWMSWRGKRILLLHLRDSRLNYSTISQIFWERPNQKGTWLQPPSSWLRPLSNRCSQFQAPNSLTEASQRSLVRAPPSQRSSPIPTWVTLLRTQINKSTTQARLAFLRWKSIRFICNSLMIWAQSNSILMIQRRLSMCRRIYSSIKTCKANS